MNLSIKDISMKHVLGKFTLFLLAMASLLHAEDFSYTIQANKHTVYEKESILLSVDFNQTNPDTILLFRFQVNPSVRYKAIQLQAKHDDTFHHVKHHNLYEIFPLTTGDVNITFSLTKRVTDEAKVRYFSSGDRDDFKKLETTDSLVNLPPVQLHVNALPKDVKLIGDFTWDYDIQTHQAEAFSPISWKLHIKGRGYMPDIKNIIPRSSKYKIFTEKPRIHKIATPQGTLNDVTYLFALSAKKSYTLAPIKLKAFNPQTQQTYFLEIPSQDFKIKSIELKSLVDKDNIPTPKTMSWRWAKDIFQYLLVFIAGFLTALGLRWRKKETQKIKAPLTNKIKEATSAKKLLQILISNHESKHFTSTIEKLESSLYGNTNTSLKALKKEILEKIK